MTFLNISITLETHIREVRSWSFNEYTDKPKEYIVRWAPLCVHFIVRSKLAVKANSRMDNTFFVRTGTIVREGNMMTMRYYCC